MLYPPLPVRNTRYFVIAAIIRTTIEIRSIVRREGRRVHGSRIKDRTEQFLASSVGSASLIMRLII